MPASALKPSQSDDLNCSRECLRIRSTLKQIAMTSRTRDTIALFAIGSLAILVVFSPDIDLEGLFQAVLSRW